MDPVLEIKLRNELADAIDRYKDCIAEIYDVYPRRIFLHIDNKDNMVVNCHNPDDQMILIGTGNLKSKNRNLSVMRVDE